jgi:diguanylate cyclase (GGDEF)-like protein
VGAGPGGAGIRSARSSGDTPSGGTALAEAPAAPVSREASPDRPPRSAAEDEAAGERIAARIAARSKSAYALQHTLAAALWGSDEIVGAIVLSRRTESWPAAARRMLIAAAEEASMALTRAYSLREAEERASTDALTGLPNRRYFDEFCGLIARRRRADDAVGVLMIDIDRFKLLNDRHGHAAGDKVLRIVASAIASAVRDEDVPARFGGEEFAVLLRNPSRRVALEVGERVREAVATADLGGLGVERVSVSVGVAVASAPDQPIPDLVADADRALYEAKRKGRDRVIAA